MSDLLKFDQFAERYEAAYAAFKRTYELRYPPPPKPKVEQDNRPIVIVLISMLIASIGVSGSRTIEEFGGFPVGYAAFAMLEGAIIAYAFFRKRRASEEPPANDNEGKKRLLNTRLENTRQLATIGLIMAFAVALVANVDAVLRESGIQTGEGVDLIISLLVAASAPTLAFISGDMLAIETMAADSKKRKAQQEYDALLTAWLEGLNSSWNAQKSRWGVRVEVSNEPIQSHSLNSLNEQVNEQVSLPRSVNSSTGYTKRMDARSLIHEFFQQHPERLNGKLDELVIEIEESAGVKVGRTSIHNVRKEIAEQQRKQ